jgi:hypothetical protein
MGNGLSVCRNRELEVILTMFRVNLELKTKKTMTMVFL